MAVINAPRAARLRLRLMPGATYSRHADRARRAGFRDLRLVLSFDCDTREDAEVAPAVHARLSELGVTPVYAVPGALLREAADVYRAFAEDGSEFLNHGGREHTYFDAAQGRHASCFFYDEIGPDRVAQDVAEGDRAVTEVIGAKPRGFRTPHFGTYQSDAELRFLHARLQELGYRFSTSTTPYYAVSRGPVFDDFGLPEFPVSGTHSAPLEILDSWSCFAAPDRLRSPADFAREAAELARAHAAAGPGLINVYADPSHVHGEDSFFAAVEAFVEVARPCGYDDLLELVA
jgi:peptidoglycan/xylan/chitin deacetylase (PgdA/CDA1 family)